MYSERSVRSLLAENSELIALQVTENASKTGEHYVSTDKDGFWGMYKAAAGAGVLIATMATLKTLASRLVTGADDAGHHQQHDLFIWFYADSCLALYRCHQTTRNDCCSIGFYGTAS